MDAKTTKRIDSLYRNINSFLVLSILSLFVPILLLFVVPLSLAYLYLHAKLLRDIDSGKITIDRESLGAVDYIRKTTGRLWAPSIILIAVIVATAVVVSAT
jgi:hypothetical protein